MTAVRVPNTLRNYFADLIGSTRLKGTAEILRLFLQPFVKVHTGTASFYFVLVLQY
jgi:hypothetical protein